MKTKVFVTDFAIDAKILTTLTEEYVTLSQPKVSGIASNVLGQRLAFEVPLTGPERNKLITLANEIMARIHDDFFTGTVEEKHEQNYRQVQPTD